MTVSVKTPVAMEPESAMTVMVKTPVAFGFRLWLASMLFRLGGLIIGVCEVQVASSAD